MFLSTLKKLYGADRTSGTGDQQNPSLRTRVFNNTKVRPDRRAVCAHAIWLHPTKLLLDTERQLHELTHLVERGQRVVVALVLGSLPHEQLDGDVGV